NPYYPCTTVYQSRVLNSGLPLRSPTGYRSISCYTTPGQPEARQPDRSLMSEDTPEDTVSRATEHDRYEITVDGQAAGLAAYVDRGKQRIFHHTDIGDDFGGRRRGSVVLGRAVAEAPRAGAAVRPVSPVAP